MHIRMQLVAGIRPSCAIPGPRAPPLPKNQTCRVFQAQAQPSSQCCEVDLASYGDDLKILELDQNENPGLSPQILLLGTNHKSYYSMEQTQSLIQQTAPDAVFLEVCAERQENLLKRLSMRCRSSERTECPVIVVITDVVTEGLYALDSKHHQELPLRPGDIVAGAKDLGMASVSLDSACRSLANSAVQGEGDRTNPNYCQDVTVVTSVDKSPLGFTLAGGSYRAIHGCSVAFTRGSASCELLGPKQGMMSLEDFLEEQVQQADEERARRSKAPTPIEFRMGVESGQEFLAAVESAFLAGTPRIVLGDQPMQATGRRLSTLRQERRNQGPAGALRALVLGYCGVSTAVNALQAKAGGFPGLDFTWEDKAEALRILEHFQHTLEIPLGLSLAVALLAGVMPGFNLSLILKDRRLDKDEMQKVFLGDRDSYMASALYHVAASLSCMATSNSSSASMACSQSSQNIDSDAVPSFVRVELLGGLPILAFMPSRDSASSSFITDCLTEQQKGDATSAVIQTGSQSSVTRFEGGRATVVAIVGSEHVSGISDNWKAMQIKQV